MRKRAGPDVGPRLLYGRTGGGGPGWDSRASRAAGTRRASARGAGSGALRSAAAGARGGSRLPRSCGARAARSRERRGKQQAGREGAGGKARAGAAGGRPLPGQAPRAGGPKSRALGVPEVREEPRAPDLADGQLRHPPPLPFGASRGVGTGSGNPLGAPLLAFSLVLAAPPAAGGRVGGPAEHPLPAPINPCGPVSVLGPALSPGLRASPPSRGCRGEGRKFPGSPPSSGPPPLRAAPRGPLTR